MIKNYPLYITLLLAFGLGACSSTAPSSSQRTERHYALGQPLAHSSAPSRVVAVETQPLVANIGPRHVAPIVYFDFDVYTVRPEDRSVLEGHADWLRRHPQQSLLLQGHTDARGGIEYNLALGQKRAESVRKGLEALGVENHRIEAVSFGKERLADVQSSDAAHQRNRRVQFEYR